MRDVVDGRGRRIRLGTQLGQGGEGRVYAVAGLPSRVAKIYGSPPSSRHLTKLELMCSRSSRTLEAIASWPLEVLYQSPGRAVGLLIPRIQEPQEIHTLYNPAQRRVDFPKADWRFLVRAAKNLSGAFETLHAGDVIVGDVNEGNIVVSTDATVKLIDCDSFQIAVGDHLFLCRVGVPHYTPPELFGANFDKVRRSKNHDAFGLAVMVFQLLVVGRHPFAGTPIVGGDVSIPEAIRSGRFAYGRDARDRGMQPPPRTMELEELPDDVGSLFRRAFLRGSASRRPTATEWVEALDRLEKGLNRCPDHLGHWYPSSARSCVWCSIERSGGPDMFVSLAVVGAVAGAAGFDLRKARAMVEALTVPGLHLPAVQGSYVGRPLPTAVVRATRMSTGLNWLAGGSLLLVGQWGLGAGLLSLVLFAVSYLIGAASGREKDRERRQEALRAAKATAERVEVRWRLEVGDPAAMAVGRRQELLTSVKELEGLDQALSKAKRLLQSQARESQLRKHLERFMIGRGRIKGIGPTLTSALSSFGIDTAAEVTRAAVMRVPGIGPAKAGALLSWRASKERTFTFDPSRGADPRDMSALERKFSNRKKDLERGISARIPELQRLIQQIDRRRTALVPIMREAQEGLAKAQADARVG